jgi:hypothetical protein
LFLILHEKDFISFFALLWLQHPLFSNSDYDSLYLKEKDFIAQLEMLKNQFGKNKNLPPELELECLVALSYFPELANVSIEFKWNNNLKSTMKMMPSITSFFFRKKMKYVVHINQNATYTNLSLQELTFNAKVGWLGHELGHVIQCTLKNLEWVFYGWVFLIVSKKFVRKHERKTDMITIEHGLGYALYEGMHYTFNQPDIHPNYIKGLKENYLSLEEILEEVKKVE